MCFSPNASFAASTLLLGGGAFSSYRALKHNRRYLVFAIFPLAFGIQQAAEGMVWLKLLSGKTEAARPFALGFLFFSHFFWPFWAPFSAWFVEKREKTKLFLKGFAIAGFVIGALLYFPLFIKPYFEPQINTHHISYNVYVIFDDLVPKVLTRGIYITIVLAPLLLVANPGIKLLAILLFLSMLIGYSGYSETFVSVWCYFAAVTSIFLILWNELLIRRITAKSSPRTT